MAMQITILVYLGFSSAVYGSLALVLSPRSTQTGSAIRGDEHRWPNAVVPYVIADNLSTAGVDLIFQAMNQFEASTCIRWIGRTNEDGYVYFQNSRPGCNADVGLQDTGGQTQVNIQDPDCETIDVIVHEMMHAVGFEHEHERPDRDEFVTINTQNIETAYVFAFDKNTDDEVVSTGTDYDYRSIMHYGKSDFASKDNLDTIVPKNPAFLNVIGQAKTFSNVDIIDINTLYRC